MNSQEAFTTRPASLSVAIAVMVRQNIIKHGLAGSTKTGLGVIEPGVEKGLGWVKKVWRL
jgi:hypothetical protein